MLFTGNVNVLQIKYDSKKTNIVFSLAYGSKLLCKYIIKYIERGLESERLWCPDEWEHWNRSKRSCLI